MMKNRASFVIVFWWLLLLLTAGGWLLSFADREPAASETENRMLQGFPVLSAEAIESGAYMTEFESFLSDRMPGRDAVISATNAMINVFSALGAEDYLAMDSGDALAEEVEAFAAEDAETAPVTEAAPPAAGAPDEVAETEPPGTAPAAETEAGADAGSIAAGGDFGMWFLRTDGRREVIFYYTAREMKELGLMLNAYAALLDGDGRVVFAQVPSANLVNRWAHGGFIGMISTAEDGIRQYAGERVTVLNAIELLTPRVDSGEYLFFRTDHHWTPLAAYYLHAAFLELQGVPALRYNDYSYTMIEGFLGSVYEGMPSPYYKSLADTIEVMEPLTPARMYTVRYLKDQLEYPLVDLTRSDYKAFVGDAKGPAWRIDTGAHTGRKLLVISDSFGSALVPYMTPYYDEVHLINLRRDMYTPEREGATTREYLAHYGIDDIFIIPSTFTGIGSDNLQTYLMEYIDGD